MLSCKEVSNLVSESLDRKLSFWQRMRVWMHLRMCRLCARFRKQTLFIKEAARRYLRAVENTDSEASPGLSPEARERIKRSLKS